MPRQKLPEQAKKLAEAVRDFTRNQKMLWKKIPELAKRADNVANAKEHAHSKQYYNAAHYQRWAIALGEDNPFSVTGAPVDVDLQTGELLDPVKSALYKKHVPATDDQIIMLALHPDMIDASHIILELEEAAK